MTEDRTQSGELYRLTTGKPLASLSPFTSPLEEYQAAFAERDHPFINHYSFEPGQVVKRSLTRGEFWELARSAAAHLNRAGISKGDRVVHFFDANSLYDLIFRLAAVLTGCVPVTINWQADDNERIVYKTAVTEAKLLIHSRRLAERVAELKPRLGNISLLEAEAIARDKLTGIPTPPELDWEDERIIVFTSGTTARPRGVILPHRSFLADRLIFEDYFDMSPDAGLDLVIVNPLHHVNSTVLTDWGLRRRRAVVHLLERYTTPYWKILVEAASKKRHWLVTALVSRHFDFLESLAKESQLPVSETEIKRALAQTDILIGSAPVGPKTVANIIRFGQCRPHVRFGATETCLETMATSTTMFPDELRAAFEAGWAHRYQGKEATGYYIGREHFPFTRLRVVKSIDPEASGYLKDCAPGEPGYLITQGANLMRGYVGEPEATAAVFREGWYTGLKDIVFTLRNPRDGKLDYYWMSRDSELLIRGGANYAYTQVAAELSRFVAEDFTLAPGQFQLAVIGLRVASEHEDSCAVTIELSREAIKARKELEASFLERATRAVTKGCRPDYLRLAPIPRSFKGAVVYPRLKEEYLESLKEGTALKRNPRS
ncbi:MAG: acyl--CoA ligase [Dehalococcoidales bacterium]|nr:acyl--CoA ligase [Dehalococcoidales bacterium]